MDFPSHFWQKKNCVHIVSPNRLKGGMYSEKGQTEKVGSFVSGFLLCYLEAKFVAKEQCISLQFDNRSYIVNFVKQNGISITFSM